MVSRIAVMALVGIIAVPILLGFAMNVSEVQETEYNPSNDPVNVTPLLQNSTSYSYAHATPYELNTKFGVYSGSRPNIIPLYESVSTTASAIPLTQEYYSDSYPTVNQTFSYFDSFYLVAEYSSTDYLKYQILDESNNVVTSQSRVYSLYYDRAEQRLNYFYYYAGDSYYGSWVVTSTNYKIVISDSGTFRGDVYYSYSKATGQTDFVDISAGFRLLSEDLYPYQYSLLPNYTRSLLITIDLSTMTDSSYSMIFGPYWKLIKTTLGTEVKWSVYDDLTGDSTELYYDGGRSSNTYQLKVWTDLNTAVPTGTPGYYTYDRHFEYRYVGNWPTIIGEANYYQKYDLVRNVTATSDPNFNSFSIQGLTGHTPVMRIDDAEYRAFEYQVIENNTYDPTSFRTNPATTLSGLQIFGSGIEFGGHTYSVKNGNLLIGTHQISLNGMVFDSVPSSTGTGYDNRINGSVVSTTANPSTITFNGKWGLSVTTDSLVQNTVTKTEWKAGQFGWDGMDHNFLIVGLLTSLGAFIALGIYARRSRTGLWPVMIVCGCAAVLFFILL